MNLIYFDTQPVSHLVEEYFEISFSKGVLPFKTTFLPLGVSSIIYISKGMHETIIDNLRQELRGLVITGQFFRSYQFKVNEESKCFGITFHPTALNKLLGCDVSKLTNKHVQLNEFHPTFFKKLNPLFLNNYNDHHKLTSELNRLLLSFPLNENDATKYIDNSIDYIRKKEGLLSIEDILKIVPFSQKTLESHFKKIVGLTPGKYTRLYRFLNLMKKYESHEIEINDLIYMYDYYDHSHFSKDFVLFMKETPKSYFKKDYPLLKKVLKK